MVLLYTLGKMPGVAICTDCAELKPGNVSQRNAIQNSAVHLDKAYLYQANHLRWNIPSFLWYIGIWLKQSILDKSTPQHATKFGWQKSTSLVHFVLILSAMKLEKSEWCTIPDPEHAILRTAKYFIESVTREIHPEIMWLFALLRHWTSCTWLGFIWAADSIRNELAEGQLTQAVGVPLSQSPLPCRSVRDGIRAQGWEL